ncbi:MAG: hypothetical protein KAH31_06645 [Candidatus Sabulitectum sp.]|nr:hypothetical protein [Candidatus Sabulitectum sp.]
MKILPAALILISYISSAGSLPVYPGPIEQGDGDWLVYDNGTAQWTTWDGRYRGVWFNIYDFVPGWMGCEISETELWFYHHVSYPWDISEFTMELWNGGSTGPEVFLFDSTATALHYAPANIEISQEVIAESNFWCLQNTELSSGGWPSILADHGTPGSIYHSYFSDTLSGVWQPFDRAGPSDFFVRIYADFLYENFQRTTWGEIKTVF